jgi:ubiquinone/menaquinone biosynthesis C-methylase UbiE
VTGQVQTTEQIRAAWDTLAPGYDQQVTVRNMQLAERVLAGTGIDAGTRMLDIAAGTGALAIPAARRGARVTATDLSPAMVDLLAERARREGLAGLEAVVADGHALDFPDGSFDLTASQFGVMLFPDLPRGLAEMARVTRPGGRVLVVAFAGLDRQEWLRCFLGAVKAVDPEFSGLPADPPPLPFQVADPAVLAARLREAGLTAVSVGTWHHELTYPSGVAMVEAVSSSNPIGAALVAGLTQPQRTQLAQVLHRTLHDRPDGRPAGVVSSEVHVATGTR